MDSESKESETRQILSKDNISWKLIDTYFKDNPNNLVMHHLDSYNEFFKKGINNIFRENNPVRFIEREDKEDTEKKTKNEIQLYLGGKDGTKIYFGKPIIYDDNDYAHYMYPNDARLRNMTYGTTIHYDVDVDYTYYENNEKKTYSETLEKIYLGRFPIMLQSDLCILKSLSPEVRFNMGECRNDPGGYFIIDGKEKVIMSQEKFADNMLYVKKNNEDDKFSYSAEIRSVSEDTSKPMRKTAVKIVAPSGTFSNNQIVVMIPNVRKEIPLFIVMRALGIVSDKQIIETCLLDLEKYDSYIDLFIPSIHDANIIYNQETALKYIASFTKYETITGIYDILMNYFLPHIGEKNFIDKAYFLGHMVKKLLKVYVGEEKPTDRDSFLYKRIELSGTLFYNLFREYFLIQNKNISQLIDVKYYYHKIAFKINTKMTDEEKQRINQEAEKYKNNFRSLITDNYLEYFCKEKIVEAGVRKGFKGDWGSQTYTKKDGLVQGLDRLSWFTFICQLRKIILPLDETSKIVGPRHLHSSQWGFIDPVDSPDGSHIGLHKHISICTMITSGYSSIPLIKWLRGNLSMKLLQESTSIYLASNTKIFVNGNWIGVIDNPIETINNLKLYRRNGLLPFQTSISFDYKNNEINIYTDAGRLIRPIYYIENQKVSYNRNLIKEKINEISWNEIVSGFNEKKDENFSIKKNKIYDLSEIYSESELSNKDANNNIYNHLNKNKSIIDYIDTNEEEYALIANTIDNVKQNKYYTHLEIDPSLLFGVMGNSIIFPEHNQFPRDVFSCGQSRQAVSMYHSNFQMRIDKMGVILNNGEIPLIKSRYLKYINNEEQPYGVNTIVAIMSYTGYNVEDAILINEGSIQRGLFRTTYYSMYESREETSRISGQDTNSNFANIENTGKQLFGKKYEYDYSQLDKYGIIKEDIPINDKTVLIGQITSSISDPTVGYDSSIIPKKGQLGFVDKSFMTEGEEGTKIAKIRIREERMPEIGDKMASRAGQKGTIGLIIPEEDMPFTKDGLRPDLIINPHALPSRMTIGQLVESILGVLCAHFGGFGDCTAFKNKGSHAKIYGEILTKAGYHSSGNQLLYNGMTGEQLQSDIYIGPTYYMRLKHMVKDKINYRSKGPRTALTRQTVQGRANDGGLRIGEMERDGILAHGASHFLNESFMIRGDEYQIAVCNKTGGIAIYNSAKDLFLSPMADGPIEFFHNVDGKLSINNISRFGRSFSIVRIPYALKLMIHELQTMNVQMRIITEDNVDKFMSMSFSNNFSELIKYNKDYSNVINETNKNNKEDQYKLYSSVLNSKLSKSKEEYRNIHMKTDKIQLKNTFTYKYDQNLMESSSDFEPIGSEKTPEYTPPSEFGENIRPMTIKETPPTPLDMTPSSSESQQSILPGVEPTLTRKISQEEIDDVLNNKVSKDIQKSLMSLEPETREKVITSIISKRESAINEVKQSREGQNLDEDVLDILKLETEKKEGEGEGEGEKKAEENQGSSNSGEIKKISVV